MKILKIIIEYRKCIFLSLALDALYFVPSYLWHINPKQWEWMLFYIPITILGYYVLIYIEKQLKKKHNDETPNP